MAGEHMSLGFTGRGSDMGDPVRIPHRASLSADMGEGRAVNVVNRAIAPDMTIREWRARRSTATTPAQRRSPGALAKVRRLVSRHKVPCDHLHDSTTRYDRAEKRLDFLPVCPVCKTEKLIHSLDYEPRFEPTGAKVHALRPSDRVPAPRRAA